MEATPQHLDLSDAFLAHAVKAWFAVVALAVSFTTAFVLIL